MKAWKQFSTRWKRAAIRPIDPRAPLWVKLHEEQWIMRFLAGLVEDRNIEVDTARGYFSQASGWHHRLTGVAFAGGLDYKKLPEMLKGLRRLKGVSPPAIRRGVSPQQLRTAFDRILPKGNPQNANKRAALATALQGLLRGREFTMDPKHGFRPDYDLCRGDIVSLSAQRMVMLIRPAKNMRHTKFKTVPIVIGAGGKFIDAHAEVANMLKLDPTPWGKEDCTPMFRHANGDAFTTDQVRDLVKSLMLAIGENPDQFGAHSLRIGGATALFAAGADPIHIKTMGRWSSDCWRLYVRACFEQSIAWSVRLGSQEVHDMHGEHEKKAQEVDEY